MTAQHSHLLEPTISCPRCHNEIKLTESLAAPIVEATRLHFEQEIARKDKEIENREAEVKTQKKAVDEAQRRIEEQVSERLQAACTTIAAEEARKAKDACASEIGQRTTELAELRQILEAKDAKLTEAQNAQAEVMRKERALNDEKRELELTIEKRLQASVAEVRQKARIEAEDGMKLKVSEKEEQIASMQRQIEELRRRAEQGSQQLQGEVLELHLEAILRERFPLDSIASVGKGEFGGDILHRVVSMTGLPCGTILWESKRTKNWSDGWLAKLRNDQRTAGADIAILVSTSLPKEIDSFGLVDGVWVTDSRFMIPLAIVVRHSLGEIASTRQTREGQATKMELVYQYLTGPRFRHRVEAIVEKFSDMQADLDRERKTMTRLWAKREAQIAGVVDATVGMYGDLQGIAGRALQEIEGLQHPLLEGGTGENDD